MCILGIGDQLRAHIVVQPVAPPPQQAEPSTSSHDDFVFAMGSRMDAYSTLDNEKKMQVVRSRIVSANDRNMFSSVKTFAIEGERLIEIRKKAMHDDEANLVAKQVRRSTAGLLILIFLSVNNNNNNNNTIHAGTSRRRRR